MAAAPPNLGLLTQALPLEGRTGTDPEAGVEHRLFDPRADRWNDHFAWSADGLELVGVTPVGRATVNALGLNRDRLKQIRAADLEVGRHPPETDGRLH